MAIYVVRRQPGAHRRPTMIQRGIDWFLYHWTGE